HHVGLRDRVHALDADGVGSAQDRGKVVRLVDGVREQGEVGLTAVEGELEFGELLGCHRASLPATSILTGELRTQNRTASQKRALCLPVATASIELLGAPRAARRGARDRGYSSRVISIIVRRKPTLAKKRCAASLCSAVASTIWFRPRERT